MISTDLEALNTSIENFRGAQYVLERKGISASELMLTQEEAFKASVKYLTENLNSLNDALISLL